MKHRQQMKLHLRRYWNVCFVGLSMTLALSQFVSIGAVAAKRGFAGCGWVLSGQAQEALSVSPVLSRWGKRFLAQSPNQPYVYFRRRLNYSSAEGTHAIRPHQKSLAELEPELLKMMSDMESWWISTSRTEKLLVKHDISSVIENNNNELLKFRMQLFKSFRAQLSLIVQSLNLEAYEVLSRYFNDHKTLNELLLKYANERNNLSEQQAFELGHRFHIRVVGILGELRAFMMLPETMAFGRRISEIPTLSSFVHQLDQSYSDEYRSWVLTKEIDVLLEENGMFRWIEIKNGSSRMSLTDLHRPKGTGRKSAADQLIEDLKIRKKLGLKDTMTIEVVYPYPVAQDVRSYLEKIGVIVWDPDHPLQQNQSLH